MDVESVNSSDFLCGRAANHTERERVREVGCTRSAYGTCTHYTARASIGGSLRDDSKTGFRVQDIFLPHPVHFIVLFYIWASFLVSRLKWDTDRGLGTT